MLMFGREIELPIDLLYGEPPADEENSTYNYYVESLQQKLWDLHEKARLEMINASNRQKKTYDHMPFGNINQFV